MIDILKKLNINGKNNKLQKPFVIQMKTENI